MSHLLFNGKRLQFNGQYLSKIPNKYYPLSNGGADGTTDWINPTNGVGEDWDLSSYTWASGSIVTGNGFTGNAQRMDVTTGTVRLRRTEPLGTPQDSSSLSGTITFKYRSNGIFTCRMATDQSTSNGPNILANTGNAVVHSQNISVGSGNYLSTIDFLVASGVWI
jgi:hypothetical protein